MCESLTESYYFYDIETFGECVDWAHGAQNLDHLRAILKNKLMKSHAS